MSQNTEALENLKLVNKLVYSSNEKIDQIINILEEEREDTKFIKNEVTQIHKFTVMINQLFSDLTNGLSHVLVALAVYLVLGIFIDITGYSYSVLNIFISYVAVEGLMSYF